MGPSDRSTSLLSPALAPGRVLAEKYRIESVLGEGGMGVVLAARHVELGHRVAIKLLLPGAALRPVALERFLVEGRAAARLTSPHAVRVHDVGRLDEGVPYLVMELVVGRDLGTVLDDDGPQPYADVVRWCREVADALVEAHQSGVIHRDIKPANLMLTGAGPGRPIVKVLDFGISKLLDEGAASLTQSSMVMGSPAYMAPEQLVSAKHVTPAVDIWAVGVVMFEMVTGRVPFDGATVLELVTNIQGASPTPPSLLVKGIPASFDAIVLKCLAKAPNARFESMVALSNALSALEEETRSARPLVSPPAAVALRPAEGGAARGNDETVDALSVHAGPRPSPPATSRGARLLPWVAVAVALLVVLGTTYLVAARRGGRPSAPEPRSSMAAPAVAEPATAGTVPALLPSPSPTMDVPQAPSPAASPASSALAGRPARPLAPAGRKPRAASSTREPTREPTPAPPSMD